MTKPTPPRQPASLRLRKTTLRRLDAAALGQVAGGSPIYGEVGICTRGRPTTL